MENIQPSYWDHQNYLKHYDLLIIGSGIVGLFTALRAKEYQPQWRIGVLERGPWPYGASTRNAGFTCFGSAGELLDDLKANPLEEVILSVQERLKGLETLRSTLGDDVIKYENFGGYEVFWPEHNTEFNAVNSRLEYLNHVLAENTGLKQVFESVPNQIPEFGLNKACGIIKNQYEGLIQTDRMMDALYKKCIAADIKVIYNQDIKDLKQQGSTWQALGNNFSFSADRIALCNNAFATILFPELQLEIQPGRTQVLVTSVIPNLKLNGGYHFEQGYNYFRHLNGRTLLGGGRNLDFKGEETLEIDTTKLVQDKLEYFLREFIIPNTNFSIDYRWSGILGLGKDKNPIIRQQAPGLYLGIRCGGMGVARGSLTGEKLAKLVCA